MKKKVIYILLSFLTLTMCSCHQKSVIHIEGQAFGTMYSINCIGNISPDASRQLRSQIDSLLSELSHTFSIFDTTSIIYRWNKGEDVPLNEDFLAVLRLSKSVSAFTDGAFDCTAPYRGQGHSRSGSRIRRFPSC